MVGGGPSGSAGGSCSTHGPRPAPVAPGSLHQSGEVNRRRRLAAFHIQPPLTETLQLLDDRRRQRISLEILDAALGLGSILVKSERHLYPRLSGRRRHKLNITQTGGTQLLHEFGCNLRRLTADNDPVAKLRVTLKQTLSWRQLKPLEIFGHCMRDIRIV